MKTTIVTFFLLASVALSESNLVWAIRADLSPLVYNAITNKFKEKTGDPRPPDIKSAPRWDAGGTNWYVGAANPSGLGKFTNRLMRIDDLPSNERFKVAWVDGDADAYITGVWGMTNGVVKE